MNPRGKKPFSIRARLASVDHALRGIGLFVSTTHNAWVEIFFAALAAVCGFYCSISSGEWLALTVSFGVLIMAEGLNTAIEVHMNLTSPEEHPAARDTKDIAAGAVFIAALTTFVVCAIIFLPKL